jgi:hypothetical protein
MVSLPSLRLLFLDLEFSCLNGLAIAVFELDNINAPGICRKVNPGAAADLNINYLFTGEIVDLETAVFIQGLLKFYINKSSGGIWIEFDIPHCTDFILRKTILRPSGNGK